MTALTIYERAETAFARALLDLPPPLLRLLAGRAIERDGRTLDPQAQLALRASALVNKRPSHVLPLARARRELDVSGVQLAPAVKLASIEDRTIGGLRMRVYRPSADARGALVYFHGGGHTSGSLDSHDAVCRATAAGASCTVVSVEYRLAPEHPFPAAADDATAAFRAVVAAARALGLDPQRIAVGGDSAGGNLAAVVSLDTRADDVKPCAQLLIYPVVDLTMSFPSVFTFAKGFFLEHDTIAWFRGNYLGADGDRRHPRASPWFAEDLSGLPRAIVVTAGFDPLRDEGDAYAHRLAEAFVKVEHRSYPGMFHGFWNTTGTIRVARSAFDEVMGLLRAAL